ncbi:MAG TPA: ribosomal protein S18-alanine N-acetyltransferase [Thermomicrobiales bacterium]|nr:ribosomal protein S18-alanine N-acetyltransferase [Thermomicrobiales bacterium]
MYVIDEMTLDDIEEVHAIETRSFPSAWPLSAYRRELRNRRQSYYVVLREDPDAPTELTTVARRFETDDEDGGKLQFLPFLRRRGGPPRGTIRGFAGMWILLDEAHITTIGVDPDHQGQGLGELLFVALMDEAIQRGATWVTLEVRVSNQAAQALYRKYGFTVQGRRPRYYSDNNEDAYIMWSESLKDDAYRERMKGLRAEALRRVSERMRLELAE